MRKCLLLFICIGIICFSFPPVVNGSTYAIEMIPEDAIRLRILANSDSVKDQQMKYMIRDEVNDFLYEHVKYASNIEEAREEIQTFLPEIEQIIGEFLHKYEVDMFYTVEFRGDVPFPEKTYGKYVYPAGEYEALLITLGEGKGKNWWCVLFPSLCYLDLSEEEKSDIEKADKKTSWTGKLFIFEWLNMG